MYSLTRSALPSSPPEFIPALPSMDPPSYSHVHRLTVCSQSPQVTLALAGPRYPPEDCRYVGVGIVVLDGELAGELGQAFVIHPQL